MTSPNRRLRLAQRRRVRVLRRFTVEDLGGGRVGLTCKTCGTRTEEIAGSRSKQARGRTPSQWAAVSLARWWAAAGAAGIQGRCDTCTQVQRDARYPL